MFYMKDGEIETSIEWYDPITGCWVEANIQPPRGRTASEHIAMLRKLAADIGEQDTVQYRIVTTVYDIK
jgi:hypothetical protein